MYSLAADGPVTRKKNLFQTGAFLLIIIVLTMFNNLEHGAELYYKITKDIYPAEWLGYIHLQAYLVIIVIDLAVIAFIVNGKTPESLSFAWLLFFINLIFWDVFTNVGATHLSQLSKVSLICAKVFFSAAFSYLIHRVSRLYFEQINGFSSVEQAKAHIEGYVAEIALMIGEQEQLQADKSTLFKTTAKLSEDLAIKERENFELKEFKSIIKQELQCRCSFEASLDKGLATAFKSINAHKGSCKDGDRTIQ